MVRGSGEVAGAHSSSGTGVLASTKHTRLQGRTGLSGVVDLAEVSGKWLHATLSPPVQIQSNLKIRYRGHTDTEGRILLHIP